MTAKIRILFLAASPMRTGGLSLDEEVRLISQGIEKTEYRDQLELISAWAVRADELLPLLNKHKPHIVHFSGHGSDGEILFVSGTGGWHSVGAEALKELFQTMKDNIRVVVINACYSKEQARAISEVIDCVIGMRGPIEDEEAIAFSASFYGAVGFGRSVKQAYEQAKVAVLLKKGGAFGNDVAELMVRDDVDASQLRLIQTQPPPDNLDRSGFWSQLIIRARKMASWKWTVMVLCAIAAVAIILGFALHTSTRCSSSSYQSDLTNCLFCTCEKAFDNNLHTRWASKWKDDEWIIRDLGKSTPFDLVVLQWEAAYGRSYTIDVSDDNVKWTTVYTQTNGTGGVEKINLPLTIARYVRMRGISRGTEYDTPNNRPYGYSLWEFQIYQAAQSR